MIFDLHCDTFLKLGIAKACGEKISVQRSSLQIDEEKLIKGGYFAQCFAMFVPVTANDPYAVCKEMLGVYGEELAKSQTLAPVLSYADFSKNQKAGKISSVLTMEDAAPIGASLSRLHEFYRLGVRMIGLTWNYKNAVGHPNFREFTEDTKPDLFTPETELGLTDFGRELVAEMNALGVAVDVSHLSDKGFYDVLSVSTKPIFATHSNARGVCRNVRNLTDDMLFRLADNGGVMGMNYAKGFVNEDEELGRETCRGILRHMLYIKNKIGVDHIGLGSDFDGIDPKIELKDASCLPLLIGEMERAGFTDEEIEKITYQNALRVFKETMK